MRKRVLLALIAGTALSSATCLVAEEISGKMVVPQLKPSNLAELAARKIEDSSRASKALEVRKFVDYPPLGGGKIFASMTSASAGDASVQDGAASVAPAVSSEEKGGGQPLPWAVADLQGEDEAVEPDLHSIPKGLQLNQYEISSFREDQKALRAQISGTRPGTVSRFLSRIGMAEFYLAHLMAGEGLSLLSGIPDQALTPDERAYFWAVRSGLIVARGKAGKKNFLPGDARYEDWSDYDFWTALHLINQADYEACTPYLQQAYEALSGYPGVFQERYLKEFLEAAIVSGKWTLAKQIARDFDEYPDLKNTSAYHFLVGLAAEKIGEYLDAFDAYRLAARGRDVYAQRARLGIIDIGLATYTMPLEDAQVLLNGSRLAWRGDQYEVEALKRLVDVNTGLSDVPSALEALGALYVNFPNSEEMAGRRVQAEELLEKLYSEGGQGTLSLVDFAEAHKRIVTFFRFFEGFEKAHEVYADRLMELGASGQAAREYMELSEYLSIVEEEGIWNVSDQEIWRLRLKASEAFVRGGQYPEALAALRGRAEFADGDLNGRADKVVALAGSVVADPDMVLSIRLGEVDAGHLRLRAQAFSSVGNWGEALAQYADLKNRFSGDITQKDMINMLLAAHRADDIEMTKRVAEDFPEVVASVEWQNIAKGLRYTPAPLEPLKRENVQRRLDAAGGSLRDTEAVGR